MKGVKVYANITDHSLPITHLSHSLVAQLVRALH